MKKQTFLDLLYKYERGNCSPDEKKMFDQFCESLNKYPDSFNEWELSRKEKLRIEMYAGIKKRISKTSNNRTWFYRVLPRIAASLLIAGVTGILFFYLMTENSSPRIPSVEKSTERGQRSTITLTDGSIIELNSESSIRFRKSFSDTVRLVELTGEAFFEVTADSTRPFIIKTGEVTTTVLGTSFNIKAYPELDNIDVTVATGTVLVKSNQAESSQNEVELTTEEQATFSNSSNSLTKHDVDLHPYLAWKDDIILLNNRTLFETSTVLSRWYDVNFRFENEAIKNCKMSGEFKGSSLENLLENMSFITGIGYRIENRNEIVLYGQSCN